MDVFWIEHIFKFNKENFQHISNNHSVTKYQLHDNDMLLCMMNNSKHIKCFQRLLKMIIEPFFTDNLKTYFKVCEYSKKF